ncbi:MAG TPA: alpha-glucuronidase family glycosyl hydrolase, partial [Sphingobacteriaceae bacterium]
MCRITLVFLWIGLTSIQLSYADSINIVSEESKAEIIIGSGATPTEKYAAAELQRVIQIMTGSELPVIQTKVNPNRSQIFIGTPSTGPDFKFLHDAVSGKASDGQELVLVRTRGNTLYISGSNPSAVLYATYTFLQDYLDVRWFWPGESGEFITKRRNLTIDEINLVQKPHLKVRSLAITGVRYGDSDTDTWMARNRMNVVSHSPDSGKTPNLQSRREKGFQIRIAGHNVVLPAAVLKEHPGYLAQVGGKRVPHPKGASQLCWSNVAVQDEVAAMIGRW